MKDFPRINTWSVTVALVCCFPTILAQNPQCELSKNQLGVCVHVNKCNNVFKILEKQKQNIPIPARVADYLKQIKCDLPGVPEGQSTCCQREQIRSLPEDCGRYAADRLIGREKASLFEFPWMALLRYYTSNSEELENRCGGTLISSRYVLTAAHCVEVERSGVLAHIRFGEYNLNQDVDCSDPEEGEEEIQCAEPVQDYEIESFEIHPQYKGFKYDIALVRLKREVQFTDYIRPICLPTTPYLKTITFSHYQVAGWGITDNCIRSDVLLKANVPVRSIEQCENYFNQFTARELRLNTNIHICAGEGIVQTCKGDSGGPLMGAALVGDITRYIQFGVTSFGVNKCGRANSTTAFTKVATMMEWILDNIKP